MHLHCHHEWGNLYQVRSSQGVRNTPLPLTTAMRRFYPLLMPLLVLLLLAVVAWPRPPAVSVPRVYPTYGVAQLAALVQTHYLAVRGRIVVVYGFFHHGCPSCPWDAPPSLTVGPRWGGPSIMVALPDLGPSRPEPWWITRWRALPLLGRLAPAPPLSVLPQGFTAFTGTITPACTGSPFCASSPFVIHVLP